MALDIGFWHETHTLVTFDHLQFSTFLRHFFAETSKDDGEMGFLVGPYKFSVGLVISPQLPIHKAIYGYNPFYTWIRGPS